MYQTQEVNRRVKSILILRGKTSKEMLNDLGLSINLLTKISKKGVASFTLARIADYLDVSTDYLLGRTDNPHVNK